MSLKDLINILPEKHLLKVADIKPDLVDWVKISSDAELSEEFIEKHKDRVYWHDISVFQKLSESFIEKYNDDVNWYNILAYQKHLSDEFKEKHMWKVSPLLRKYLTENNSLEELN